MNTTTRKSPLWKQVLGVASHLTTLIAVLVASSVIWRDSQLYAIIYLAIFASWYATIFTAYCSKCPCHLNCTHLYMGRIASRLFKTRRPGGSSSDYLVNSALLIALIAFPQYWLKDHLLILLGFWLIMIAMGPMITPLFCPDCDNTSCPVHSLLKRE